MKSYVMVFQIFDH